jgi:hypothetical protein
MNGCSHGRFPGWGVALTNYDEPLQTGKGEHSFSGFEGLYNVAIYKSSYHSVLLLMGDDLKVEA